MDNFEKRGKFLSKLRLKYNLKQSELGSLINYSNKSISRWERGISFPNDPKVIIQLADLFDVSVEEILNGEYKNNNEKKIKTSFECKLLYFRCLALKYNFLLLLFFVLFFLFFLFLIFNINFVDKLSSFGFRNKNKSAEIETYFHNKNGLNINEDILVEYVFVKDGFKYYKSFNNNIDICFYYKMGIFKLFGYDDSNNFFIIYSKTFESVIYLELYDSLDDNVFIFDTKEIKNCDIEDCNNYNDYVMYINYLKKIIRE